MFSSNIVVGNCFCKSKQVIVSKSKMEISYINRYSYKISVYGKCGVGVGTKVRGKF